MTALLGLLVLAAAPLFMQGNPIITPPSTTTIQNNVTVSAPPPDPAAIADASVQSTQAVIVQVAAPIPVDWDNQLFNLPDLWRQTPPDLTYENGAIRGLADGMRVVGLALLALATFAAGAGHALGQGAKYGRLAWAVVLCIGELPFWAMGIGLNNAICAAINAPDLPSLVRPHIALNANPGQQAATVVLVIVYAIVALLVMLSLLFRLGLLQVLIAIGPLALICMATEQSEHFAHKYITLSVGLLFSQVLVVLGMRVAQVDAAVGTGVAGTFMALVVLLLLRKLPALVSSTSNTGRSTANRVVTAVVTRRIAGVFR